MIPWGRKKWELYWKPPSDPLATCKPTHYPDKRYQKVIAERIQANSRWPADMVARYGGDEFCVVLPATDEQTAVLVAERIREGIASTPVPTRIGPLKLTISLGTYAAVPTPADTCETFLERADQALYQSKQDGRNRVTLYNVETVQNG